MRAWMLGLGSLLCVACVGQTGGNSILFPVAAAGPEDAVAGQPLAFSSGAFDVVLTQATLHVGAVYLDQTAPVSGQQATGCYLTGTYLAQETSALNVDLLNPALQPFPSKALGITEPPALIGQVWLTGGDINAADDTTPILMVAGTATESGTEYPLTGTVTIGANHVPTGAGTGGGDPICKQRIVTPIPAALTIQKMGGLLLRIDPRLFFAGIDFSQLPAGTNTADYVFSNDPSAADYFPTGQDLFSNLTSIGPYTFSWTNDL
jgi:hypothetical protein